MTELKDIALLLLVALLLLTIMATVAHCVPVMVPVRVSWDQPDITAETFDIYTKHPGQEWVLRVENLEWWQCKNRGDCGKEFSYTHLLNLLWVGRVTIGVRSVDETGNPSVIVEAQWIEVTR